MATSVDPQRKLSRHARQSVGFSSNAPTLLASVATENGRDRHVVGLVVERVAGSFAPETSSSGEWVVAEASGGCRRCLDDPTSRAVGRINAARRLAMLRA